MSDRGKSSRPDGTSISVRCLFFARYEEFVGAPQLQLELASGATVADAVQHVRSSVSGGEQLPAAPLVAKNQRHVQHDAVLENGDELAFLPPLAGG